MFEKELNGLNLDVIFNYIYNKNQGSRIKLIEVKYKSAIWHKIDRWIKINGFCFTLVKFKKIAISIWY